MKRVLVVGATGTVGKPLVERLTAVGAPVRALVRSPGAATLPEVEIVSGDLTVPETLGPALNNVDAVFLVWTVPFNTFPAVLERITRNAQRIVFLSAPLKTPHPLFQQPNPVRVLTEKLERLIEASGLQWTFLRPGMLAINAVRWWAGQIRAGDVIRWPYASVPTAPIHEQDIAAVAVRALCDDGHAGAEHVLTGPQSLTHAEQISMIGRAIGRPLRMEEITPEEAGRELSAVMPPFIVTMLMNAWSAAAGEPAFVTSTVAEITGTPARAFFDWAIDHAAEFQADRGSAGN
ncbi:MAG: NAD(P)H-binding protein [Bryobacteraceae bacterium]